MNSMDTSGAARGTRFDSPGHVDDAGRFPLSPTLSLIAAMAEREYQARPA